MGVKSKAKLHLVKLNKFEGLVFIFVLMLLNVVVVALIFVSLIHDC